MVFRRVGVGGGALGLFLVAACGGRAEREPPGAVEVVAGFGGSTAAQAGATASKGGSPSASAGAGAVGPAAGGAVNVGSPSALCRGYCEALGKGACANEDGNSLEACAAACTSEVSAADASCQRTAADLIACLQPILANSGVPCEPLINYSRQRCSDKLQEYDLCSADSAGPEPGPPPNQNCNATGTGAQDSCTLTASCADGKTYVVACKSTGPQLNECSCMKTGSEMSVVTVADFANFACEDALAACGGPNLGAPR